MELEHRSSLVMKLHVLNQKAERELTQKLQLIDKQFKFSYKTLQQRKDFWRQEQRKVGTVRICEPKAIVDVAMEEINEFSRCRAVHTAHGRRRNTTTGSEKQSRSVSAPARQRSDAHGGVSLLQMKNIALIDSISEKERVLRRQRAREEMERMRRERMEALRRQVQEFIERLKEERVVDPPEELP